MNRWIPAATAAVLAAAAAFALGRLSVPSTPRPAASPGEPVFQPPAPPREIAPPPRPTPPPSEVARPVPPGEVDAMIDALTEAEPNTDIDLWGADTLAERLLQDPAALARALARFRSETDPEKRSRLAVALGLVRHPDVQATALDMALRGADKGSRLAGLDLLDRLDDGRPETVSAVRDLLELERDPEILAAALYALHYDAPPPANVLALRETLGRLRGHSDGEVRARGLVATAEWALELGDLYPVFEALEDPEARVRAAAAYALGQTRWFVPEYRPALVTVMSNPREDWEVRELAWRALARYPLDESAYRAYREFQREWERVSEGR